MSDVTPLPVHGEVFLDVRGDDRTLRVNRHPQVGADGLVVLSLWRDDTCVGSFRLRPHDAHLLSDILAGGARSLSYGSHGNADDTDTDDADDADTQTIVRVGSADRGRHDAPYLSRAYPTHRGSSVRPPNAGGLGSRSA
ncbi:hypothetical protein SAMN05421678_10879 [Actinopolymorpha cephalotaxi]|uniref:Uncharacterized protein n=1 Tax=Actinopolymorpha cephalotaxi TaxID=504797 RepID=A0A1I2UGG5_9ACTN|nr:hypothetical protein [Actinopolymorpha cephalotaxi]NYH86498.1 hypothetical protein [Actinopolymorpha cephalotaxi]SFG73831.1 hypothetical protein SAMN05421678_10879 [Actinopolymorpha cephalotaxi]